MRPRSGCSTPATLRRKVDFPEPLAPTIPTISPSRATKLTPRSARTVVCPCLPTILFVRRRTPVALLPGSLVLTVYRTWTFSAMILGSSTSESAIVLLPSPEEQESDDEKTKGPNRADDPHLRIRIDSV